MIAFLGGKLDRLLTIDRLDAKEVMIFGRQTGSAPSAFHCGLSKNRLIWDTVLLADIESGLTILIRICLNGIGYCHIGRRGIGGSVRIVGLCATLGTVIIGISTLAVEGDVVQSFVVIVLGYLFSAILITGGPIWPFPSGHPCDCGHFRVAGVMPSVVQIVVLDGYLSLGFRQVMIVEGAFRGCHKHFYLPVFIRVGGILQTVGVHPCADFASGVPLSQTVGIATATPVRYETGFGIHIAQYSSRGRFGESR